MCIGLAASSFNIQHARYYSVCKGEEDLQRFNFRCRNIRASNLALNAGWRIYKTVRRFRWENALCPIVYVTSDYGSLVRIRRKADRRQSPGRPVRASLCTRSAWERIKLDGTNARSLRHLKKEPLQGVSAIKLEFGGLRCIRYANLAGVVCHDADPDVLGVERKDTSVARSAAFQVYGCATELECAQSHAFMPIDGQ